ncbi:hypothetical protein [Anaerocolumna xylanovorans]|uniref:Uncharacterized protein n=1 Tax=Anaerocolumna xylanovorans DSM 12503 TaxID=1121345 RepID=A0A1M7YN43_9FIRM|nr:hypothetical protein [Anaerocolumna xylanovorans]SHO54025.1 hypothetical protein SAMN02745217_04463 [Anaerocolumna xylanovorans DSM 12503]
MPGGWNYQAYLTPYDTYLFYHTMDINEDYFYIPLAVATQVVNGTNYRFITIAEPKDTTHTPYYALVEIYKPLEGDAQITNITAID